MSRPRAGGTRLGLTTAAALIAFLALPPGVIAAPSPPSAIRVLDGEGWQADDRFQVGWTIPAANPPVAAVRYRVRNPEGLVETETVRIDWPAEHTSVWVRGPGTHTIEVWLEDTTGAQGPPADVRLRFDPAPPAEVTPIPPGDWIGRTELPYALRLTHPSGTSPLSGIRGYAVSIDRLPTTSPCAASYLCTDAETDLRGGPDDDTLLVPELPEGTSYAHSLAVSGSGVRSLSPGHMPLQVDLTDPVTRLTGLPQGWVSRPVVLAATATDSLSGMAPKAGGAPFTAIRIDGAPPVVAPGGSVSTTVAAPGVHTVSYYARDVAGNVNDGADSNGHGNRPPSTTWLGLDSEPPTAVFTGSTDPEDPELIEARVADRLSGPDPGRGVIAVRAAGSSDPFEALPTAGAGAVLLARWRSEDQPPGEYEFRVTGYDAAGNAVVGTRRANGEPMVLPSPLKARATLAAGFGWAFGERPRTWIVRRGSGVRFSGRLAMSSDASPAGRSVRVVERFDPGASEPRRATSVPTDPDGRFSLRLEPGPSREVFAVFDGTSTSTGTASGPLRLGVRAGVSLGASTATARVGGRPVVFRGTVAAGPDELPPGGATVQLQFRAAGLRWTEFRTVRTGPRGRFRYPYRFIDDDSRGIRFRFRALVPTQNDWPYEAGASRAVAVSGR